MPEIRDDWWNLAMGHGIFVEDGYHSGRSSPIRADQIQASGRDYVALGHHHGQRNVSSGATVAYYCGAPERLSDHSGTFVTVDLEDGVEAQVSIRRVG